MIIFLKAVCSRFLLLLCVSAFGHYSWRHLSIIVTVYTGSEKCEAVRDSGKILLQVLQKECQLCAITLQMNDDFGPLAKVKLLQKFVVHFRAPAWKFE